MERIENILNTLPDKALVLLHAATSPNRNHDVQYPFRQNSTFFYLTKINEPYLCIAISNSEPSILYHHPVTDNQLLWDGEGIDHQAIVRDFQLDQTQDITKLSESLQSLMDRHEHLIYDFSCPKLSSLLTKLSSPKNCLDIRPFVDARRLIKGNDEIECIRKATNISVLAHLECIKNVYKLDYEYQVEAQFLYTCQMEGARYQAYPCIVASGANACILHYNQNNQKLKPDQLLLIDAGCEYQNYASDITRTYPINGRFSEEQRLVYQAVLNAQEEAIANIKPGITWDLLQQKCKQTLTKNCIEIGLLKGTLAQNIKEKTIDQLYYHGLGHWLGLDVHDAGPYHHGNKDPLPLEANMVLTIEPGLYIRPHQDIDQKWWNIGVRIEDDILVTPQGCENLSSALPKSVKDIENLTGS